MAFGLLASFPRSSSITTGSYVTRALWHKNGKLSNECCIKTSLQHSCKLHYKGIEGGSLCDKFGRKYFMIAASTHSNEPEAQVHDSKSILESTKDAMDAFRKFSRPYALIALVLGILSSSLLAVENLSDISPTFFIGLLQHLVANFFMHMYIVGVNQLADLEIDKINKPYLPLASREFSFRIGLIIVSSFLFMSIGLGWMIGSKPLLWGLYGNFVLMTAYSVKLPLLRWKKSTMLTVLSGVASMIISFNLSPFLHMKNHVLKKAAIYSRSQFFTIVSMSLFYAVISMVKDIPDIEGDKALGIQTLSVRLGPKRVFWFCVSLLELAYGAAILGGATSPFLWSKIFTVLAHAFLALILWYHANSVDLKSKASVQSFYMDIFKLLYVEYIVTLFIR